MSLVTALSSVYHKHFTFTEVDGKLSGVDTTVYSSHFRESRDSVLVPDFFPNDFRGYL